MSCPVFFALLILESPRIESEVVGSPPKQTLAMLPGSRRLCLVRATVAPYEAGNEKGKVRQAPPGAMLKRNRVPVAMPDPAGPESRERFRSCAPSRIAHFH